jgi:hypothetical protein
MNRDCPYEIKLLTSFESNLGQIVERTLHNKYSHKKTYGEWFDLELEDEVKFVDNCEIIEKNNINNYADNRYT